MAAFNYEGRSYHALYRKEFSLRINSYFPVLHMDILVI